MTRSTRTVGTDALFSRGRHCGQKTRSPRPPRDGGKQTLELLDLGRGESQSVRRLEGCKDAARPFGERDAGCVAVRRGFYPAPPPEHDALGRTPLDLVKSRPTARIVSAGSSGPHRPYPSVIPAQSKFRRGEAGIQAV